MNTLNFIAIIANKLLASGIYVPERFERLKLSVNIKVGYSPLKYRNLKIVMRQNPLSNKSDRLRLPVCSDIRIKTGLYDNNNYIHIILKLHITLLNESH